MYRIAEVVMHVISDNALYVLVRGFVIVFECIKRTGEKSRQTRKNTAVPAENKAEQEFLAEARELRENASNNTIPVEDKARQEFFVMARVLSELMDQALGEKMDQLAAVADGSAKDHSAKSAMLSPAVFAEAMNIILRMDAHSWQEIEPVLAVHLKNVVKREDEWEWV
jgi:hypothetical protein